MKNAIIYARVSTEEQAEGFSINAQLDKMREYCRINKIKLLKEFVDAGFSAGTKRKSKTPTLDDIKRPDLQELRQFYSTNKTDFLIIWKQDRLSRDTLDMNLLSYEFERYGVRLISVTENLDNPIMLGITSILSAEERRKIGERTRLGLQAKLKLGGWAGLAPLGYLNWLFKDGDKEERIIIEDPKNSIYIKMMFDLYSTGNFSLEKLANKLNERGLKTRNAKVISKEEVKRMLSNKFYVGLIAHKLLEGLEVRGKHKAIISKTLFDKAQAIMEIRQNPLTRDIKHIFLFNGLLYCEHCGHRLSGELHKGHRYYGCIKLIGDKTRCSMGYVPERDLLPKIEAFLERIQLKENRIKLLEISLKEAHKELMGDIEKEKNALEQNIAQLKKKKDKLIDLVSEECIKKPDFNKRYADLENEERTLEDRKSEIEQDYSKNMAYINRCLKLATNCKNLYSELNPKGKKELIKLIFNKISVRNKAGKIEDIQAEFSPIFEWISHNIKENPQFRYVRSGVDDRT